MSRSALLFNTLLLKLIYKENESASVPRSSLIKSTTWAIFGCCGLAFRKTKKGEREGKRGKGKGGEEGGGKGGGEERGKGSLDGRASMNGA